MGGICSSPAAVQAAVEGQADVVAGKAEQAIKATTVQATATVTKPPSNSGAKPAAAAVAAPPKASDSGAKQPPPAAASAAAPAKGGPKQLTILHFNDVYNIEPGERDPVGGAARLQTKIKSLSDLNPLVLFSGDCFNPSLMSTITKGKQMVPILNAMGVQASCVGNHDFDYGTENLVKLARECDFPWLMANVLDKKTGEPYAQAKSTHVLDWQGVKVGLVGLVEEEWLATLGAVDPKEMKYVDFVALGRKLANQLKAEGCDIVVALTHMREPNDRKLCAEVPEIDLVLGGHDHHYIVETIKPHGTLMAKSGTDFRDMTQITLDIPGGGKRVDTKWQRHVIDSKVQEDPEVAAIVKEYMELMGSKMDEVRGLTTAELDGRFKIVRTRESNLGNFITDIWRLSTHVDLVILNSGSLRSDQIHPTGEIKAKDLVAILPMIDETVVLLMTGAEVVEALENGVSQYPKLEGRFPQVSGVRFSFDPSKPPGSRIVPGSVSVNGARLLPHCRYKVATKAYLAAGKDGYDVFLKGKVLVDSETGVTMPTMLRNHFAYLDVLNQWDPHVRAGKSYFTWKSRSLSRYKSREMSLGDLLNADQDSRYTLHAARSNGVYGMAVHHPESGSYAISPRLDGRINNIAETCCQVAWSYGDSTVSIKLVGKDVDLS